MKRGGVLYTYVMLGGIGGCVYLGARFLGELLPQRRPNLTNIYEAAPIGRSGLLLGFRAHTFEPVEGEGWLMDRCRLCKAARSIPVHNTDALAP